MEVPAAGLILQGGAPPSGLAQFLPFLLIFVIFYLVLFLPMQRKQKKHRQMLEALKNGDHVVTNGGILGVVVGLNDDNTVVLRVKPDNVKLQFSRSAISSLLTEEKK
jgi:preprotein translocase subunit YajC